VCAVSKLSELADLLEKIRRHRMSNQLTYDAGAKLDDVALLIIRVGRRANDHPRKLMAEIAECTDRVVTIHRG